MISAGSVVVDGTVVAELVVPGAVLATDCVVVDAGAEVVVTGGDEHEKTQTESDTSAVVNLPRPTQRVLTERS